MIQNGATHINCIINDYLDYISCKNDQFKPKIEKFKLKPALMSVLHIFRLQAEAKRIKFTVRFDDTLPIKIETDKPRLQQVVRNLVSNALKYTVKGHITIEIRYNHSA